MEDKELSWVFGKAAADLVEKTLRILLEEKHLYQAVKISIEDLNQFIEQKAEIDFKKMNQAIHPVRRDGSYRFRPIQTKEKIFHDLRLKVETWLKQCPFHIPNDGTPEAQRAMVIVVPAPTVKNFCPKTTCSSRQPHNIQLAFYSPTPPPTLKTDCQQVFFLQYLCQSCKKSIVTFLVKRDGLKLTLSGRDPIEEIDIPCYIPKEVKRFYRGAVLAFNCGQYLPALFMLRTTIEQHMRKSTQKEECRMSGDEISDAYLDTLPNDFKSRFPSLKPVYDALSVAIHEAQDNDGQLFETERDKLLAHFEAKEMFQRLSNNR